MTIAEAIFEQVKTLAEPLAREVLDFVEFIGARAERGSWRDQMEAQTSGLASVWDNPDDAVWDDA